MVPTWGKNPIGHIIIIKKKSPECGHPLFQGCVKTL